ncbi:Ras-related protein ORAB-1 [Durusdinium trenchii]|uniref:Ras-related protein ORAB-1 n=1 Tax=Durusdinium trenchii TaxID=1381693 RepID=A0ABP0J1N3_9DINO
MPVYEEKLISPLAVRFSQDRVRTTFRNGQSLEEVIELVKVKEVGDKSSAEPFHPYDVILQPPFSNIEVVRWGPRKLRVNGSCGISLPGDEMHWYTNCNQRLYVLQRVAAKYWPKKVACEVDVLFTVPNELLKTYDSSTAGLLAALSESAHCESASVWNWGRAVTNSNGKMDMALERAAMKQLEKDDASCTLADLVSIPHVLKTESRAEVLDDAETFAASTSSEQVMASPRIQSSSSEKQEEAEVENKPKCEAEKGLLEGQWRGPKGETYQMSFEEPSDDDENKEAKATSRKSAPSPKKKRSKDIPNRATEEDEDLPAFPEALMSGEELEQLLQATKSFMFPGATEEANFMVAEMQARLEQAIEANHRFQLMLQELCLEEPRAAGGRPRAFEFRRVWNQSPRNSAQELSRSASQRQRAPAERCKVSKERSRSDSCGTSPRQVPSSPRYLAQTASSRRRSESSRRAAVRQEQVCLRQGSSPNQTLLPIREVQRVLTPKQVCIDRVSDEVGSKETKDAKLLEGEQKGEELNLSCRERYSLLRKAFLANA